MTINSCLKRSLFLATAGLFLVGGTVVSGAEPTLSNIRKDDRELRKLPLKAQTMNGDFDEMLKLRAIRVAVPFSRTLYYIDKGHERGLTAQSSRDFERYLNKKYARQLKKRPITVYVVPTTRDKLLEKVVKGKADIAAGNLTITAQRQQEVDFVEIPVSGINEIVVTSPQAPSLKTLDDLAGQTIHVRTSSSYHESLLALNKLLTEAGKPPLQLVPVPDALEDEDMLEMLNAGIFGILVVDNWKARLWSPLLPEIRLHEDLTLRTNSAIGWAVRKGSSGLKREVDEYLRHAVQQQLPLQYYRQMAKKVKGLKNNAQDKELKKFQQTVEIFKVYGQKYRFDPLLLAAQGYQESRLDQNARSHVGAIGIMQVMPSTGASMRVGNIKVAEPNIHAGAKYLDMLLQRYFADAAFSEMDRTLFGFAAYNAGPGNIAKMRREAAKRGLDPNVWFNNVEMVTAERIGSETTGYVRNVFKYYAAYRLVSDRMKDQEKARQQVQTN